MAEYRLTTAVDVKFALDLRFQFLLNELQEFSRSALFGTEALSNLFLKFVLG